MAIASGEFVPGSAYERVRPVFRPYAEAQRDDGTVDEEMLNRIRRERDALALRVVGTDGTDLPVELVMIYDFGEEAGAEGYLLDVCLASFDAVPKYWPEAVE